jgi:hypothetical protein
MTNSDLITQRFQDVRSGRLKLPSIRSELGIEAKGYVYLEARSSDKPTYIRGVKSEKKGTPTEGYYKVSPDHRIEVGEWWRKKLPQPLKQVSFEFYTGEDPHFRIYEAIDYALYRVPKLKTQGYDFDQTGPAMLPIGGIVKDQTGSFNFASYSPYTGQKFRINPFNSEHQVFDRDDPTMSDQQVFRRVVEEGSVPQVSADKITIAWDPAGREYSENNWELELLKENQVQELEVTLPEKGSFGIFGENTSSRITKIGGVELYYSLSTDEVSHIGGDWYGKYHSNPGDTVEYVIYLPYTP